MQIPLPTISGEELPWLTAAQMAEVDRAMIEDYRIDLTRMMENAGRNLARLAVRRFLDGSPVGRRVLVVAGHGGNGGGALVAARRLRGWGAVVEVVTTAESRRFAEVPGRQLDIVERLGLRVGSPDSIGELPPPDVVLDGIIGYSLHGVPRGGAAEAIAGLSRIPAPVLSLDVPSGVDVTTGVAHEPAVRAAATMTLALPKHGLRERGAAAYVGELYLADIGVPPDLYRRSLRVEVGPIFARGEVLRVV